MRFCCPSGCGCNAPSRDQACALEIFREAEQSPDAAVALARWSSLEQASAGERRFRRRAYQRARDRALMKLAFTVAGRRRKRSQRQRTKSSRPLRTRWGGAARRAA